MTEPRLFAASETIDLDRLVALTGAAIVSPARAVAISGIAALDWAGPTDLCCLPEGAEALELEGCDAGACLLKAEHAARLPAGVVALVVEDPAGALATVSAALFPPPLLRRSVYGVGVSAGAIVHPEARLEPDVSVEPGAVIGPCVEIGRGALIGSNAVIGAGVRIGRDTVVGPGAVVENALVGDRVTLAAGVRLGQGPARSLGRVIIQDGVEIGANSVAARGSVCDTVVGESSRIGALARIGAGSVVGRLCVLAAGEELAEGARLSDHSTLGSVVRAL